MILKLEKRQILILSHFGMSKQKNYHGFLLGRRLLDWNPPFAKWFVGGQINASYNALDVHQETKSEKPAILWEGENGDSRTLNI